jgi:membrane glycosyltransferase
MNMLTPPNRLVGQSVLPVEAPLDMLVRVLAEPPIPRPSGAPAAPRVRRAAVLLLAAAAVLGLGWSMAEGLQRDGYQWSDALLLVLYLPIVAWTAFAAATAVLGFLWSRGEPRRACALRRDWMPSGRTAILIPARNEDVDALEARLRFLRDDLGGQALGCMVDIFVLSHSDDPLIIHREEQMADALAGGARSGESA